MFLSFESPVCCLHIKTFNTLVALWLNDTNNRQVYPQHQGPIRHTTLNDDPVIFWLNKTGFVVFSQAKFTEFKIQNMVGSCDVKFPIRLEGLVLAHGQFSR